MDPFHIFIENNMVPITFAYGLAYFSAGLAIALQQRNMSNFRLAQNLWMLGAFGIIHGAAEWGDIFIPIQSEILSDFWIMVLSDVQEIAWAVSFAFLLQFAVSMLAPRLPYNTRIQKSFLWSAPIWSLVITIMGIFLLQEEFGKSWIRYMLGFPGAVLTAIAFLSERRSFTTLRSTSVKSNLTMTAAAFGIYAILAGLIVPRDALPGLHWLNYENVHSFTGVPIQFWRMIIGVVIAFFVTRTLSVFDLEVRHRLETVEKNQALGIDRERIARDLHDGVVQSIYAAGLQLEAAVDAMPAGSEEAAGLVNRVMLQLNLAMTDIRRYIFKLGAARIDEADFDLFIRNLVDEFTASGSISVKLSINGTPVELSPEQKQNIAFIAQECLSNVVKHADARAAEVRFIYAEDALLFSVEDDGTGFDRDSGSGAGHKDRRGLVSIRERADMMGAELFILSGAEDGGTRISLKIPYHDAGDLYEG